MIINDNWSSYKKITWRICTSSATRLLSLARLKKKKSCFLFHSIFFLDYCSSPFFHFFLLHCCCLFILFISAWIVLAAQFWCGNNCPLSILFHSLDDHCQFSMCLIINNCLITIWSQTKPTWLWLSWLQIVRQSTSSQQGGLHQIWIMIKKVDLTKSQPWSKSS